MCQPNVAPTVTVGKVEFSPDQRAEIDFRVHQKLWEREYFQQQYTRGVWDCLYVLFIAAMFGYLIYINFFAEDK